MQRLADEFHDWLDQTLDALQPAIGYSPGGRCWRPSRRRLPHWHLAPHGRSDARAEAADDAGGACSRRERRCRHSRLANRRPAGRPAWRSSPGSTVDGGSLPRPHRPRHRLAAANRGLAIDAIGRIRPQHRAGRLGVCRADAFVGRADGVRRAGSEGRRQRRRSGGPRGSAVLLDRQLPGGGLNYGNTYVLGQLMRPHVQPTGIALLALAGEADASGRIAKTDRLAAAKHRPRDDAAVARLGAAWTCGRTASNCRTPTNGSPPRRSRATTRSLAAQAGTAGPGRERMARHECSSTDGTQQASARCQPPGLADRRRHCGGAGRRGTGASLAARAGQRLHRQEPDLRRRPGAHDSRRPDRLRPGRPSRSAASACCSSRTWSSRPATART